MASGGPKSDRGLPIGDALPNVARDGDAGGVETATFSFVAGSIPGSIDGVCFLGVSTSSTWRMSASSSYADSAEVAAAAAAAAATASASSSTVASATPSAPSAIAASRRRHSISAASRAASRAAGPSARSAASRHAGSPSDAFPSSATKDSVSLMNASSAGAFAASAAAFTFAARAAARSSAIFALASSTRPGIAARISASRATDVTSAAACASSHARNEGYLARSTRRPSARPFPAGVLREAAAARSDRRRAS